MVEGGAQNDYSLSANLRLRPDVELNEYVQYERWTFPLLDSGRHSDFTTSLQLTFYPKKFGGKRGSREFQSTPTPEPNRPVPQSR